MHGETSCKVVNLSRIVKREKVVRYSAEEWSSHEFRRQALDDARAWLAMRYDVFSVLLIKVKDGKRYVTRASLRSYP